MVRVATASQLRSLGVDDDCIDLVQHNGFAFSATDHRGLAVAAFGIVFEQHGKGEVWTSFSSRCRRKHLLRLIKLFKKVQNLLPHYFVLGAIKDPKAVAFEKLALMCGFKLIGQIQIGNENFDAAIYGGQNE